jgi:hypothetical protein
VAGGDAVVVAINNAGEATALDLPAAAAGLAEGTGLQDRLGGGPPVRVTGGRLRLALSARSASVYAP